MQMFHHVEQALIAASKQNFACYVNEIFWFEVLAAKWLSNFPGKF